MTEPSLSQVIATFAVEHPFEALPLEVIDSVRKRVLDVLGICVAASDLDTSAGVRAYASSQGGRKDAHAVGLAETLPASLAALVNGTLAHSLDYDDTHLPSVLHPSASVIPAALAMAETHQRNGEELIAAIACGLEVCVRLGMAGYDEATGRSLFFDNGQHATSICGTLGSVVATSLLAGFDSAQITHALAVAASMGSGVIEANRTGGSVKRMHCGWAAHAACVATDLVHHGFTGPPTILEGRFGFFQAWLHGEFYPEWITSELGIRWEVPGIFFKPYPANHFTHTAIDAAAALRVRGVDFGSITRLELGVPASIVRTIGEPIETKRAPSTAYMAQFSGPYAVALGLLGGGGLGAGLDDYSDELAEDPARREIMAKVSVVSNDECTAIFPLQFPAVLRATLSSGEVIEEKVLSNLGGGERPLSGEQLAVKFSDNARRHLSSGAVRNVEILVDSLETLATVTPLFDALAFEAR
ncbi:MAG: MmgE/PrpD family protein [Acidimicrobiales bacterium]